MREYWRFVLRELPLLTYGVSLTFMSSVGQTFLVSLFVPHFLQAFPLDEGGFGVLYSGATLASALLLPWVGQWMDWKHLHRFTLGVVGLLAAAAFLMASAGHVAVLAVALVGIRLGGQGLSTHTALTAMARYFGVARGKALSISNLGFPLGEGVLPLLLIVVIGRVGWRWTWVGLGTAVLLSAPVLVRLLERSGVELDPRLVEGHRRDGGAADASAGDRPGDRAGEGPEEGARDRAGEGAAGEGAGERAGEGADRNLPGGPDPWGWNRRQVVRDPLFWLALPAVLLPGFWVTGFFLYQTSIATAKGWSTALMASAFVAFAAVRVLFTLGVGGGIDRFSARRLLPLSVLPLGLGIGVLWLAGDVWAAYAFMALLGVTMGMSNAVHTALWSELYGTRHLGAIRSMMGSLVVVSTAASPALVGFVMEGGGLEALLAGGVVSVAAGAVLALWVDPAVGGRRDRREPAG